VIIQVNLERLRKWKYFRYRGIYQHFNWLLISEGVNYYFEVWNEYQYFELPADCDKTIKQIIEEGINEYVSDASYRVTKNNDCKD
jgi:hypothetical protein